jgi:hypothetical protein
MSWGGHIVSILSIESKKGEKDATNRPFLCYTAGEKTSISARCRHAFSNACRSRRHEPFEKSIADAHRCWSFKRALSCDPF